MFLLIPSELREVVPNRVVKIYPKRVDLRDRSLGRLESDLLQEVGSVRSKLDRVSIRLRVSFKVPVAEDLLQFLEAPDVLARLVRLAELPFEVLTKETPRLAEEILPRP